MPRNTDRECACGCGKPVTKNAERRHLHRPTTKSVLVAQEHNYAEQRRRLLRAEALALAGDSVADHRYSAQTGSDAPEGVADDDFHAGAEDVIMSDPQHSDECPVDSSEDESETDSTGDPFEGRPEESFWEDSDEEDDSALGDDFQAAPWLQGLSAQERLQEVFNMDAATRGMFGLLIFN
ncbi:hypothetical protein C8R44DRAFT_739424 [Mycena epipterygia]|nr:hypothetical protein C8R44DRAFT_739424 [Mycena epipterygia]